MFRYEILFLTVPAITADESAAIEKQTEALIKTNGAFLISFERWGKYRLAYPVRNNEYGVYYLVRFEVEDTKKQQILQQFKDFFAINHSDLVMRSVITTLGKNGSLEYRRPESLDAIPHSSTNQEQDNFAAGSIETVEEEELN